jgi:hypothetical protein
MGKAKRKINRLRRKLLKNGVKRRIPVPPPGYAMRSDKDYDRSKMKQETKKLVSDD